jgi:hypothetical protein
MADAIRLGHTIRSDGGFRRGHIERAVAVSDHSQCFPELCSVDGLCVESAFAYVIGQ